MSNLYPQKKDSRKAGDARDAKDTGDAGDAEDATELYFFNISFAWIFFAARVALICG